MCSEMVVSRGHGICKCLWDLTQTLMIMSDPATYMPAEMPTEISGKPARIVVSTPAGPANKFYELMKGAE